MAATTVALRLNEQQSQLLGVAIERGEAADLSGLAVRALRERGAGQVTRLPIPTASGREHRWRDGIAFAPGDQRILLEEFVLQPGTGKAIEMRAGEVLRIEQIEGAQCVDFNCFNLHDYREAFHTGRTRTLHGINPGPGDFLWSAPPRERAMMFILADSARQNDVLFPRCSANLYETAYGYSVHTNCSDIQAEAQREYGLTPDDVHDSFNLFMSTDVLDGMPRIHRQSSSPGDHVEFLATMDVLAVPNICGADVMKTSNFSIKPVLVQRFQAAATEVASVPRLDVFDTQRHPGQFRQPVIRTERGLLRDPDYVADFPRTPVVYDTVEVTLDPEAMELLHAQWRRDLYADQGEALRDVLFSWWVDAHGG